MDVDQDGQPLAEHKDRKDIMHTILERAQHDAPKSNVPEESVAKIEVPAAEESTSVLDRPREREGDGEAQQSSTPMRKTPH